MAGQKDEDRIVQVIRAYKREAEAARRTRMAKNRINWQVYMGEQDWSYKQEGQSTEFIPKLAEAADQFCAYAKRALTQFGDWFSIDAPRVSALTGDQLRELLKYQLTEILVARNKYQHISVIISNALKMGLLESLIVLKVHGFRVKNSRYYAEPGSNTLKESVRRPWRLRMDIVPTEDYYPDPTGRNLYEIHSVERDLADVIEMAEAGLYDKKIIETVHEDFEKEDYQRKRARKGQDQADTPKFRRRCVIDECWGTILSEDGLVEHENIVSAVMNDKYLIRAPEKNPFWHGESPFVVGRLVQTPDTVWSKAMYDDAAQLNIALNELFNLILDGGIAEVWGVRQVRTDWLEDPRQVAGGIPQGATLAVKGDAPVNGKVVEKVSEGSVPANAMQVYSLVDREGQAASLMNDIRMGFLPPRAVKATEVVATEQSTGNVMDSIVSDIETEVIACGLKKAMLCSLQFSDQLIGGEVIDAIGNEAAFELWSMTPAERFAMFSGSKIKVFGLSATMARARDFQKIMALMQAVITNPLLMQSFVQKFSPDKTLETMLKSLNINPESLYQSPEELAALPARLAQLPMLASLVNPGGGAGKPGSGPADINGGSTLQSELNQGANPTNVM